MPSVVVLAHDSAGLGVSGEEETSLAIKYWQVQALGH